MIHSSSRENYYVPLNTWSNVKDITRSNVIIRLDLCESILDLEYQPAFCDFHLIWRFHYSGNSAFSAIPPFPIIPQSLVIMIVPSFPVILPFPIGMLIAKEELIEKADLPE